ncbi:MAG: polysaccharide biosynthesis protein GtrA [Variovorax sp. 67-131]|nr:MAG: polysaccharide biosynthesis protein GtrA [Variovorax sp. SCN 67-85]ODV23073.1 MAG: polysaccharide biosynthesis protein GtrA [Variovorax sp. SCN 67-20]OJZ12914.1 MAG: polysaccharide biosynthesis protein GtrA [Variovorax sp. 67-131]
MSRNGRRLEVLSSQLLRFLLVGGLNTAVGYALFAGFVWAGLPYPGAIALATVLGVAFNFQSTGRLVFGGAPLSQLGRFVAVYGVVYLINVGSVALLLRLGFNVYLANATVLLPLALVAFVLQRRFVFASP